MEGTIFVEQDWLREWPVETPTPMFTGRMPSGLITATALPSGSIQFEVANDDGNALRVTSIPISLRSRVIKLIVAWKAPDDLTVFANGAHIASLLPADLPLSIELPLPRARRAQDFSVANNAAKERRALEETARAPRPGFRLRTLQEEIRFLSAATQQLRELVAAIDGGHDHHFHGTIALIRSLIARGGRNFQPLVQRVAGRLDQPLILYAPIYEDDPVLEAGASADYRLVILPERKTGDEAGIDLDVWLTTPGISGVAGHTVCQNDLIRLFADTAGSHFDPDAAPNFDAVEGLTFYRGDVAVSVMNSYAVQVAKCVCHLNDGLLRIARERA